MTPYISNMKIYSKYPMFSATQPILYTEANIAPTGYTKARKDYSKLQSTIHRHEVEDKHPNILDKDLRY